MRERFFLTYEADGDLDSVPHVKSDPMPRIGRVSELWAAIKALEDECQCWTDRGPAVKRLRALLGLDAPA